MTTGREPTLRELEAAMAAAADAQGEDSYLARWRASLSRQEQDRSRENLKAFIAECRASLRE